MNKIWTWTAAAFCATLISGTARPCSIYGCRSGEFSTQQRSRFAYSKKPESELSSVYRTIPANTPAILWRLNEDPWEEVSEVPDPKDVVLSSEESPVASAFSLWAGEVPEKVDFLGRRTFVLVPDSALPAETGFRIADMGFRTGTGSGCDGAAFDEFRTGKESPYPTTLGTLEFPDSFRCWGVDGWTEMPNPVWMDAEISDSRGSCTAAIGAGVAYVRFRPSDEAAPWTRALYFQLYVDDVPWTGTPLWKPEEFDMLGIDPKWSSVFAYCGAPANECQMKSESGTADAAEWLAWYESSKDSLGRTLVSGKHAVRMQAWLPGTEIVLETATLEIDIQCPERVAIPCADASETDAGLPSGDDSAGESTAGCSAGINGEMPSGPVYWLILLMAGTFISVARRFRRASRRAGL